MVRSVCFSLTVGRVHFNLLMAPIRVKSWKYLKIHKAVYAPIHSRELIQIACFQGERSSVIYAEYQRSVLLRCKYHRWCLFHLSGFDDVYRVEKSWWRFTRLSIVCEVVIMMSVLLMTVHQTNYNSNSGVNDVGGVYPTSADEVQYTQVCS